MPPRGSSLSLTMQFDCPRNVPSRSQYTTACMVDLHVTTTVRKCSAPKAWGRTAHQVQHGRCFRSAVTPSFRCFVVCCVAALSVESYEQAKMLAPLFNTLVDKISRDGPWLREVLKDVLVSGVTISRVCCWLSKLCTVLVSLRSSSYCTGHTSQSPNMTSISIL